MTVEEALALWESLEEYPALWALTLWEDEGEEAYFSPGRKNRGSLHAKRGAPAGQQASLDKASPAEEMGQAAVLSDKIRQKSVERFSGEGKAGGHFEKKGNENVVQAAGTGRWDTLEEDLKPESARLLEENWTGVLAEKSFPGGAVLWPGEGAVSPFEKLLEEGDAEVRFQQEVLPEMDGGLADNPLSLAFCWRQAPRLKREVEAASKERPISQEILCPETFAAAAGKQRETAVAGTLLTVEEVLDQLERRLFREMQAETEGVYR